MRQRAKPPTGRVYLGLNSLSDTARRQPSGEAHLPKDHVDFGGAAAADFEVIEEAAGFSTSSSGVNIRQGSSPRRLVVADSQLGERPTQRQAFPQEVGNLSERGLGSLNERCHRRTRTTSHVPPDEGFGSLASSRSWQHD